MTSLLTALLLASLPAPSGILAPLGRYGDVVTEPPRKGHPATEIVLSGRLPGCSDDRALWLSRAVSGTVTAGEQLVQWLEVHPEVTKAAFGAGKDPLAPLAEALALANDAQSSAPVRCGEVKGPWKLPLRGGKPARCSVPLSLGAQGQLDFVAPQTGKTAARVRFGPAPAGAVDGCRPRISVALLDKSGTVRLLVHADFGGAPLEITLGGKRPLAFALDPASQLFRPVQGR
ncbi:MAG: hypothetical protein RL653_1662 [Pseudomonadota bacterium]|jgi:hypothetical protein